MASKETMEVMQVREGYSIRYRFKPFLTLINRDLKNKDNFLRYLKQQTSNWKSGDYFIKCKDGTFAYFNLEGNRITLQKSSNAGRKYLCWDSFGRLR